MTNQSRFLHLPRELRDKIYSYYVFEVNGYCYNPHTGKLRVGGEPEHCIDQSLQYTCKMVAAEMRGLGLRENTIHFKAVKDHGTKASRFEWLLSTQQLAFHIITDRLSDLFTLDVFESLLKKYPNNNTLKELIKNPDSSRIDHPCIAPLGGDSGDFDRWMTPTTGETPSLNRALSQDMIQIALSKPSSSSKVAEALFQETIDDYEFHLSGRDFPFYQGIYLGMLDWRPCLWKVPTETELKHAEESIRRDIEFEGRTHTIDWYWSACTSTIRFLSALEPKLRLCLRHIIIHEDRNCVAQPETHARGLIPFMQENRLLYVEQHVDINHVIVAPPGPEISSWGQLLPARPGGALIATPLLLMIVWIIETTALRGYGMPEKSFSLTFHGLPSLQQKLWDILKEMAMCQEIMLEFAKRGLPNHLRYTGPTQLKPMNRNSNVFLARPKFYVADGFSEAIKEMVSCTSNIHFPAAIKGEPWDLEESMKEASVNKKILIMHDYDDLYFESYIEEEDLGIPYDGLRDFYWNGEEPQL